LLNIDDLVAMLFVAVFLGSETWCIMIGYMMHGLAIQKGLNCFAAAVLTALY